MYMPFTKLASSGPIALVTRIIQNALPPVLAPCDRITLLLVALLLTKHPEKSAIRWCKFDWLDQFKKNPRSVLQNNPEANILSKGTEVCTYSVRVLIIDLRQRFVFIFIKVHVLWFSSLISRWQAVPTFSKFSISSLYKNKNIAATILFKRGKSSYLILK